ncbi:hypothetical protein HLK61_05345, partial [Salmonella enterica subsp. enterica serovar Infantis]|uniref:heme exporter protein CcmB n=1 Tax=Salmonella enterica TaxID=28901 RepID=UPI001ADB536F|nr:hypothetical protein [Salmonella enterica subsp. enterica serovar Infantis]
PPAFVSRRRRPPRAAPVAGARRCVSETDCVLMRSAAAAMDAASMHLPADGYLAVLGALLAGSATLSPFATAAALRISTQ